MLLERGVQVVDVRRVMLVVMDPHRLLVDVRLQRVVVIRQRGNFVAISSAPSSGSSASAAVRSPACGSDTSTVQHIARRRTAIGDPRDQRASLDRPSMRSSETRRDLLRLGDGDLVVDLALDEPFEHPQQMVRRDAEHRRAQAAERVERDDGLVGATSFARRLTRWISVATAHTMPGGLLRTVLMMCSVEPLSSAAWTTSNVHSGWR